MGVTSLMKVINDDEEEISTSGVRYTMGDLVNTSIIFDAMFIIYRNMHATHNVMTDAEGNRTGHLKVVLESVISYAKNRVKQLWIFDNPVAPVLKAETRAARAKKADRDGFRLRGEDVESLKELLKLLGVPYYISPAGIEAEHVAAMLTRKYKLNDGTEVQPLYDYVFTRDTDVLMFGGKMLQPAKTSKSAEMMVYDTDSVCKHLRLTYDQFVNMCIGLGCDFADKVNGVGVKRAVAKAKDGIKLDERQRRAKAYITSDIHDKVAESLETITTGSHYDREACSAFLIARGFNRDTVAKKLDMYESAMGDM